MPRVCAVILNWNGWRDTLACVASVRQSRYPALDLVLVDNGSTDGSEQQLRQHCPDVPLLQTGANLGFGGGCNHGIRHAMAQGADFVWLVNSDATVAPDALDALITVAASADSIGAVGGILYEMAQPQQIQLWGGGQIDLRWGLARQRRTPGPLDTLSGACLLLRRDALNAVGGGFDTARYFMYWEDTDLCFRLRQAGWQLAVAQDAAVWHKLSASLGRGSALLDRYFTTSGVRFLRHWSPTPRWACAALVGRMLVLRVSRGQWARARAVWQGFRSA
ncbi:MAG: glycosyltransferase family 2 protein [Rhodoferax sp.]